MRVRVLARLVQNVAVVTALIAATLVGFAGPASAAPTWKVVASAVPAGPGEGVLSSVACATATSCFAVGESFVHHWNGTAWAVVTSPPAPGGKTYTLLSVACSGGICMAVGDSTTTSTGKTQTLAERWNGTAWSVVTTPNPAGTTFPYFAHVTCTSATNCFAVGSDGGSPLHKTLVERWNGTVWAIVASPNPAGASQSDLFGASCPSATLCYAVGWSNQTGPLTTLVETWNGSAWSITPSPSPAGASQSALNAVSCSSATNCLAVGQKEIGSSETTLTEKWNGTAWSSVASPNPSGSSFSQLLAVSCPSATACFAVGGGSTSLIEKWNGTTWSLATAPAGLALSGVACTSVTACWAVGSQSSISTPSAIVRWNGSTWTLTSHTGPVIHTGSLVATSCADATNCFGVGHYTTPGGTIGTLIERPSGTAWAVVASPNPAGVESDLQGVSCASATDCFGVGRTRVYNGNFRTLIEHWNGTAWSITPSPNNTTQRNELRSVSCVSATSCFAVGLYGGGVPKTLVLHWNGTAWAVVTSPNKSGSGDNELSGVSCASATSCMAVGIWQDSSLNSAKTLILRMSGSTWAVVASPNPSSASNAFNQLFGVSCVSATNCYAAGNREDFNQTFSKTLIEHWNGSAWAIVASPNVSGKTSSHLDAISCPTTTSCYAVGRSFNSDRAYATLVEHLAGTFAIQPSPNMPNTTDSALYGVKCATATQCVAVGIADSKSTPIPLVEQYS